MPARTRSTRWRWASVAAAVCVVSACGGRDAKPPPSQSPAADPTPSAADIQAFAEERDRLLAKDARVEVEKICKSWIERANPIARAEGHKCLANVLMKRAPDTGDAVLASTAAQRIAMGATAPEPRFSGVEVGQAIDQLALAATLNPADLSIHQGRLFLALGSGDYGRAVKSLEASLRAYPQAPPEVWLGYMGGFPRAKAHHAAVFARLLVEQYPSSAAAHVALGAWLDVTGNQREAKQHLERALELDPNNPMAHWRLGEILEQLNDNERARARYKASIALDGDLADERRSEYERRQLAGAP